MMIRVALAAMAAVATFSPPACADVTVKSQDGTLELTLPNGWRELKPDGLAVKILAVDGRGARVIVRVLPKEDFKDIKAVANFTAGRLKLIDDAEPKFEDVQVNGKPAVRLDLMGTEPSGMRAGFIITVFEVDGMYIDIMGAAKASAFTKQAQVLAGFANQLKITPIAATNPSTGPTVKPQPPVRH